MPRVAARKRGRPKKVLYRKLRARMEAFGLSAADIGKALGVNASAISRRLNGETPWVLWETYRILELLDLPDYELYQYFPASGEDTTPRDERRIRSFLNETHQSLVSDSALDALISLVHGMEEARSPGAGLSM